MYVRADEVAIGQIFFAGDMCWRRVRNGKHFGANVVVGNNDVYLISNVVPADTIVYVEG